MNLYLFFIINYIKQIRSLQFIILLNHLQTFSQQRINTFFPSCISPSPSILSHPLHNRLIPCQLFIGQRRRCRADGRDKGDRAE